jgi:hypothetical protein
MEKDSAESTNRLLRVMIALTLRHDEHPLNLKQQVEVLDGLGMKPIEIAETLGKTGTYINKELSGIRKSRKSK